MSASDRYRKTYPISWEQLHRDAKALAWRLLDKEFYKGIVAVTRGGLVPAAIVARELDIHLVDTYTVDSLSTNPTPVWWNDVTAASANSSGTAQLLALEETV